MTWLPWVLGVVVLAAAGFGAAYLPRQRAGDRQQRTAWAAARAALDSAAISRDATQHDLAAANDLYARAELLIAGQGGVAAAEEATDCAERADRMWQEATGE